MLAQRSRGNPAAPVTTYEFSDFQCPFCRQFWEKTLPVLEKEYISTGKMRLIFVNLPIPKLHPNATEAHNFAMCAARQDKFWRVHDLLYSHQHEWEKLASPSAYFRSLADSASLDTTAVVSCMRQRAEDWLVQADSREANGAGISGTPAFIINGGLLPGAQPIEIWRPIVDSIYRVASTRGPAAKKE
jgi:protein-disulfide isomerase